MVTLSMYLHPFVYVFGSFWEIGFLLLLHNHSWFVFTFFFLVDVDEVFSTFLAASAHSLVFYLSKFFFFLFDFDCLFASCLELLMGLLVKKLRWLWDYELADGADMSVAGCSCMVDQLYVEELLRLFHGTWFVRSTWRLDRLLAIVYETWWCSM